MTVRPSKGNIASMPGPERFVHGTRSRYVSGCRCDECRAANTRAYHERMARAKATALELGLTSPTSMSGYRLCPGVGRRPCPHASRLRVNSGACCHLCRDSLVWNGNVMATPVRNHLRKLSTQGVGYKSVATAADVSRTVLAQILSGKKKKTRAQTAKRVLSVTAEAIADHGVVDGAATWLLLDALIAGGMTKAEIARRLGFKTPAIQIKRGPVLARTAYAVAKLHRLISRPPEVAAPAPALCGCARAVPFELDGEYFCGKCELRATPADVERAQLARCG